MSDPNQGQPINPSKLISGICAMTQSARRHRENTHIPKRERGRGKGRADGEGSSQATQPEQSLVVDVTTRFPLYLILIVLCVINYAYM